MTIIPARPEKFILPAILLLIITVLPVVAAEEQSDLRAITWLGYNEARSQGRDFDKPVFLHFTAPWCKWCKKMKKETYTDPRVIRFMTENYTAAMIDKEKLPSLARKYGVSSLPTLWFLDSQGKALTKIEGFVGPEKLLRVLEYVSTKAYEEVDYQTWVRRRPAN